MAANELALAVAFCIYVVDSFPSFGCPLEDKTFFDREVIRPLICRSIFHTTPSFLWKSAEEAILELLSWLGLEFHTVFLVQTLNDLTRSSGGQLFGKIPKNFWVDHDSRRESDSLLVTMAVIVCHCPPGRCRRNLHVPTIFILVF